MKSIYCAFFAGASLLATLTARAQQHTSSEAVTTEQRLVEDFGLERLSNATPPGNARNASTLLQYGAGNTTRLDQRNISSLGNQAYVVQAGAANVLGLTQTGGGNAAYVSQSGNGNNANFTQDGQGNSSTITQRGTGNQLTGLVDGDRNQVNVRQEGSNNRVNTEIREDKRIYNISQYGYGNTLTQRESTTSLTPQGYSVEMRGAGIKMTIEQSKVVP